MRSDKGSTGFKGVRPNKGRYQVQCNTTPCHNQNLGRFGTPEEAAQAYLQHWQTNHPKELEKERQRTPPPVLLPVQEHFLMRSDKSSTGFKGVFQYRGRYQAKCTTASCHNHNYHGTFDTPEEAAQAYLQHWETNHPEELEKERAPRPVLLPVQEHLLMRSDRGSTGFKGVHLDKGRYKAKCDTPPCSHNYLGMFGTPEEGAQAYLQHWETNHPEKLRHRAEDGPPLSAYMRKRLRVDVQPDAGQRALSVVVSTPSVTGGPANVLLPASLSVTGGCAGAGLMPLTINPAPPLITSGAVQPVPAPRQADGGGAQATAAEKLKRKREQSNEQKQRKRAQAAADAAGCDDADELNLLVAQATEAGECTRLLLPTAKCDCKKCAAERKQKKDALNQQRQRRKS
jgi:hypothetical protein